MKKKLMIVVALSAFPTVLYSGTAQDLRNAYQPAVVVSVTKLDTTPEFYFDVKLRLNCALYVAKYKSAKDYIPAFLSPNSSVDLRVEEHWIYVFLPPDREVQMRRVSGPDSPDEACLKEQAAHAAELIPTGTILPITLNSGLRADKTGSGSAITATIMQDVPAGRGRILRAGSKVSGHVVEAVAAGKGSDESKIAFQFDRVEFDNQRVQVTTNLRALASVAAVDAARVSKTGEDVDSTGNRTIVQIGGDQAAYGQEGAVVSGAKVVGESTSQGVVAHFSSDVGTECRGVVGGNQRAQAFWLFSSNACGTYGFDDVNILHAGRTAPVGLIVLTSSGKNVKVDKGSAMLLRVDSSSTGQMPAPQK